MFNNYYVNGTQREHEIATLSASLQKIGMKPDVADAKAGELVVMGERDKAVETFKHAQRGFYTASNGDRIKSAQGMKTFLNETARFYGMGYEELATKIFEAMLEANEKKMLRKHFTRINKCKTFMDLLVVAYKQQSWNDNFTSVFIDYVAGFIGCMGCSRVKNEEKNTIKN